MPSILIVILLPQGIVGGLKLTMHDKLKKCIADLRAHTVAPLVGIREIFYGYEEFPSGTNYLTR